MLFVRYRVGGQEWMGILRDGVVTQICGSYFGHFVETDRRWALEEVTLLAPSQPSKVVVVGLMYRAHIEEMGWDGRPPGRVSRAPLRPAVPSGQGCGAWLA